MQKWERDRQVSGLYKRVGTQKTVWAVKARLKGGAPVTVTLGRVDALTVSAARKLALEAIAKLANGINPNEERRHQTQLAEREKANAKARGKTLREAIDQYLALRERKPATIKSYRQTLARNFSDWLDKPLQSISRDSVLLRFQDIKARVADRRRTLIAPEAVFGNPTGEGEAQRAFRYLGAICNSFGRDVVGDKPLLPSNPVDVLKDKKIRRLLRPRQRFLSRNQVNALYDTAKHCSDKQWSGHSSPDDADFVMLLLMTGLRVDELRTLTWKNIAFEDQTLRAVDTKNHNEHLLPLTGSIGHILQRRLKSQKERPSIWVFPSSLDPTKPASMSRTFDRMSADINTKFTAHDLRRTFATVASEMGIDVAKIGAALNHKKAGITSNYIQTTPEMLASTLQAVQDAIFAEDRI